MEPGPMQPDAYAAPGAASPAYPYKVTVTPGRVKGAVSDYRDGTVTLDQAGVLISGNRVLPAGQRALILIASAVLCVGVLVAAILVEYVIRLYRPLQVPWNRVDDIVLEPAKSRACLVYRPDEGSDRPQSLAFKLTPELYAHFDQVAHYLAPTKTRVGKIGPATSPALLAVFVVIMLLVVALAFWAGSSPGH